MRYETRRERIGERVGDVDWSYDFRQHFDNLCANDERRNEQCDQKKGWLRKMEIAHKEGREILATNYGGWPRCGLHRVIDVGMYDGWPYWKPVPSVMVEGTLGPEWYSFCSITDIEEVTPNAKVSGASDD